MNAEMVLSTTMFTIWMVIFQIAKYCLSGYK